MVSSSSSLLVVLMLSASIKILEFFVLLSVSLSLSERSETVISSSAVVVRVVRVVRAVRAVLGDTDRLIVDDEVISTVLSKPLDGGETCLLLRAVGVKDVAIGIGLSSSEITWMGEVGESECECECEVIREEGE